MTCVKKSRGGLVILACLSLLVLASTSIANPDPCLVVYPNEVCTYHYDVNEYYTVTVGDSLYDPMYDLGGEVLIEIVSGDIAWDVYQAPNLAGFEPSTGGNDGFFMVGNDFDLIVDGWSNGPTTYANIILVFEAQPNGCTPIITVDGNPVLTDPGLGQYYPIGDLVVSTPVGDGTHYSDTVTHAIHWELCSGVWVWAFADEDEDLHRDGNECFTAFSHDLTVPVQESTWSRIKALY